MLDQQLKHKNDDELKIIEQMGKLQQDLDEKFNECEGLNTYSSNKEIELNSKNDLIQKLNDQIEVLNKTVNINHEQINELNQQLKQKNDEENKWNEENAKFKQELDEKRFK